MAPASVRGVRSLCIVVSVGLFSAGAVAEQHPPTACTAVRADVPPVLDGRLEEPLWERAIACGNFSLLKGEGKRLQDTTFRVAYDDAWLYLGVNCVAPKLNALHPLVRGHDRGACNDESVELFLDPGTGGRLYFHYMLSYANARDERRVRGAERELLWDVPWRSATYAREDGWSGELALPLYVLASYGRLQDFRLNVTRNHRVPVVDAQNVVVEENRELSSWAEVDRSRPEGIGMYVDGKPSEGAWFGSMDQTTSLSNTASFVVGKTQSSTGDRTERYFAGQLDFLRVSRGTLEDSETTIEELYKWQFDGPSLKDFYGRAAAGRCRDAGAIEYTQP